MTRSALRRFQSQDWAGLRRDAEARLHLYDDTLTPLAVELGRLSLWAPLPLGAVRRRFAGQVGARPDREIAETFFNSAIRRLNGTVGVDEEAEFLDLHPPVLPQEDHSATAPVPDPAALAGVIERALTSLGLDPWADRRRDAIRIAARLRRDLPDLGEGATLAWLPTPFVRNRRAFLVGRLTTARGDTPVVVAIGPSPAGLAAEALVHTEDDASIVFGFSRSHFLVDLESPRSAIAFLHRLLPAKRLDELYSVIGYHRHGKREFYQDLHRHLAEPDARFDPIEGVPGMVMLAFVFKPMNAVFKLIRDRALPPKQTTRREVMARYRFVFVQEHGGRLADTQEFIGLRLPDRAFTEPVREELRTHAADTARLTDGRWAFSHLYTERRMTPLDVFLRTAPAAEAAAAVVDFGRAIKELAGINVFPGDMLPKNFGVSRHGRVIFYDYDEICALTDCRFRVMPAARSYDEEMAAEPWFGVGENDIFPEEFERFIRFREPLHSLFRRHHADLFDADFWNGVQRGLASGEVIEPAPYGPQHLLS